MEESILNEQDVVVEIIEYYYDDWDETDLPLFRIKRIGMVMLIKKYGQTDTKME